MCRKRKKNKKKNSKKDKKRKSQWHRSVQYGKASQY
jgi:hypothetical protein